MALDITEQVEAEQRLSRRAAQQTVLLELSRAGLEGRETADFLATAVELVARGTETQFGTILELRPSDDCLIRVAAYGHSEGIPPDPVPIDASYRDTLNSEDLAVALDFQAQSPPPRTQWMIECGVVASMAVGIRGPMSPFGVFSVHSNVAREFSADDLEFMQLASTIISVAVERKRGEKQRRLLLGRLVTAQEAERWGDLQRTSTTASSGRDHPRQHAALSSFRMVLLDGQWMPHRSCRRPSPWPSAGCGTCSSSSSHPTSTAMAWPLLSGGTWNSSKPTPASAGSSTPSLTRSPPQVRILLFRIFQEALVNVRKHAHATTVTVSLKTVDGGVMMRLSDDGAGFQASAAEPLAGHLGLASMRERAEIAGGWWRLTSEPGRGTEISTWVPAPRDADASAARAAEVTTLG